MTKKTNQTGAERRAQARQVKIFEALRRRGKGAGQGLKPLTKAVRRALREPRPAQEHRSC